MSRYTCYYNSQQNTYRELATKWMKWASTANITEAESRGISKFFGQIARRFGLIREFRELGII